ncbi:MAG TPA: ABC transporter permease [Cyclobacteriaceae bacterium]
MTFKASLRSEFLKIKRTSIIYLVLIAALIVPLVLIFDHGSPDPNHSMNGWDNFYKEGFMVFVFVFLPLFFVLASTLLMQIEVRNHAWKQVLASPQSFLHILLSKFTVIQVLAFVFLVIFNVYMMMGAAVIDMIFGIDFLLYVEQWQELLKLNAMAYGATIGVSALSFWIALRSKNFITPIAIGFLLWLFGPTIAFEFKWPHADKYVYALPFTIVSKRFEHDHVFHQILSIGYGVFFFGIAYLEFVLQRTSITSYLKRKSPSAKSV